MGSKARYALDRTTIRRLTPEGRAINKRIAAVCGPLQHATPEHALHVLQSHVWGVVIAAVATAPDDPVRWMAHLEAALLVAVDIARDLRHEGGAAFLDTL